MKLAANWLTENHIDFEYKKYMLLAYLQGVEKEYKHSRIYPWLSEVIEHYRNLMLVKNNAESMKKGFHKELKGIDWQKLQFIYEEKEEDLELIRELREIIEYSIPLFYQYVSSGKKIYDYVEENLFMQTVGITPLNNKEGYLLLHTDEARNIHVFQYCLSFLEDAHEYLKSLSTEHIDTYNASVNWGYEQVKSDLISKRKELPNPAVYAIKCKVTVPFQETLLPIVKRYFAGKIAA